MKLVLRLRLCSGTYSLQATIGGVFFGNKIGFMTTKAFH